jgi:hypothetical protein
LTGILSLSASKVLVENSTMTSPGPQHFNVAQGSQVTTLNTTFDKSKVFINLLTSKLTVKWWIHIKVNESDGDPAIGSQTWLNDTFESTIYSGTTDSQGWIKWVKVTEYYQNVTDKLIFNTHIATALNNSERGMTSTDIGSYQIIYIDLGLVRDFPIPVFKGWNMISIPINLTTTNLTDTFSGLDYKEIRSYNASDYNDHWKQYDVDKVSTPFEDDNDLTQINITMGLWVLMDQNDILKVTGGFPNPTIIQLKKGWNFVGYPSLTPRVIDDANLPLECDLIIYYNASMAQWEDNNPISPFDPIGYIRPRDGYWLHVTDDAFWIVS